MVPARTPKARRPRRARKRRAPKFARDVRILFRPDNVAHRREFGHWEGDLMLFKQSLGQTNVTSLVERVSRFTVLLKTANRRTKPVMPCPAGDCEAICREGQDREGGAGSARGGPQIHHLRPRHGVRVMASPAGSAWNPNVILRPLLALAERYSPEHQPAAPPLASNAT